MRRVVAAAMGWIAGCVSLSANDSVDDISSNLDANLSKVVPSWTCNEYGPYNISDDKMVALLSRIVQSKNFQLAILANELNLKIRPSIVKAIRFVPKDYPAVDSFLSFPGRTAELTQIYVQLIEKEDGVAHFRIFSRSAQHRRGDSELSAISQPAYGWQIARKLKGAILEQLSAVSNDQ
jgi:hypothetical protein